MSLTSGLVSFVGAGPGDPALRTQRAADTVARADVVVRDDPDVPVARSGGRNPGVVARLVDHAKAGRRVARLVAGGALEQSAVLEEVRAVARAGVPFEVVPGVGARATAAAFAGVAGRAVRVTATDVAGAVKGEPGDAPVTLIAAAGEPSQRVVVTTASAAAALAPSLGETDIIVAFGAPDPDLCWFERRPLFGKRVLVTRAREQAGSAAALLRDEGAEALVVPTIEFHPPADPAPLARALSDLRSGAYRWVAFTSANGVERVWETVVSSGGDARWFGPARLAAIGPATSASLRRHGLVADVVAAEFRGEGLAEAMKRAMDGEPPGARVLVARAAKARDALPDALRAAGCTVDVVAAYQTRPPPREAVEALVHDLEAGRVDAVMFTSSSTVENLCDLLSSRTVPLLGRTRVASIGPITTEAARARGLRVDVTADEYTVVGLVRALAQALAPLSAG